MKNWNTGTMRFLTAAAIAAFIVILAGACEQLEKPETKAFYSETEPPRAQEFRWSNGKMPATFDPARASAPPETDIVRAIYEGLTEIDPNTLEAGPAIAVRWESIEKGRVWTFELRRDAKWSNGESVTAEDFVRSWKRLSALEDKPSHFALISNIAGMATDAPEVLHERDRPGADESKDGSRQTAEKPEKKISEKSLNAVSQEKPTAGRDADSKVKDAGAAGGVEFGVSAVEEFKLRVTLREPDSQFPRLAAHTVLRPVYGDGVYFSKGGLSADIVTNGAFVVKSVSDKEITLQRSDTFFGKSAISLERVRLVAAADADSALADYRSGKVDAVTNTEFEPLALKLLTPFVDFRRKTHSALNFYEFNRSRYPFNDRRVREALAISIDRKRITEDIMEGATEPAYGFLPYGGEEEKGRIKEDIARGKELLQKAGFQNGEDFPVVKLVINRNDLQKKIAEEVAQMWKENLGVSTEIELRDIGEIEEIRYSGEYDLIRRGAVLPTSDETANMLAIFRPAEIPNSQEGQEKPKKPTATPVLKMTEPAKKKLKIPVMPPPIPESTLGLSEFDGLPPSVRDELTVEIGGTDRIILTEDEAILQMPAIPLYFPTSYSLVKPYVAGFDINALDAPLLKAVKIDSAWKSPSRGGR
jgi:oligopeptide transport system substrate-binding protein